MVGLAITYRRRSATVHDEIYYEAAERESLACLTRRGALRSAFIRTDGRGLVMLMEGRDEVSMRQALQELPTIAAGVRGYRLLIVDNNI